MGIRNRNNACMRPDCNVRRGKNGRGLCDRHHLELHRQVRDGKTTWAALEAQGLCLPQSKEVQR